MNPSVYSPSAYAQAALEAECRAVAATDKGSRNERLNVAAFAVASLVKDGMLDEDVARGDLLKAALACGLSKPEALGTIKSAFRSARPRGIEPVGTARTPEPMSGPARLAGTRWESLFRPVGEPFDATWDELLATLSSPPAGEPSLWSPAEFQEHKRGNEAFIRAHAVILDIDKGNIDADTIKDCLGGLRFACHTTRSSTPEARRWRVIIPLVEPVGFAGYRDTAEAVAGRLPDGTVDPASFKPAQGWFTAVQRPGYEFIHQAGRALRGIADAGEAPASEMPLEAKPEPVASRRTLAPVSCPDLMLMEFPPERPVVAGLLNTGENMIIAAPRGAGKSWFASSLAVAAATGSRFLRWECPEPRRVLVIDGEMPARLIQKRLAACQLAIGVQTAPGLSILARTLQSGPIPDLGTREGQAALAPVVEPFDIIVLDNISTLTKGIENEREAGWLELQDWLIGQRGADKTIIAIAHTGKDTDKGVRGSSAREDTFECVAILRPPKGHEPADGCRFKTVFTKLRSTYGATVASFEAWLEDTPEGPRWRWTDTPEERNREICEMAATGMTQLELAGRFNLSTRTIKRIIKEGRES
jgi:putative DNA primase/helicase